MNTLPNVFRLVPVLLIGVLFVVTTRLSAHGRAVLHDALRVDGLSETAVACYQARRARDLALVYRLGHVPPRWRTAGRTLTPVQVLALRGHLLPITKPVTFVSKR